MQPFTKLFKYLVWAFLVVASVCVFVPAAPWFPNLDGDSSWMFAANQAVAQKLVFGRDFIFNYGPYASIQTGLYHPATYRLMLLGSSSLAVGYSVLMILLARGRHIAWMLVYGLFLKAFLGNINTRDSLLFSYPLLLALIVYFITLPDEHPSKLNLSRAQTVALIIAILPLGLLPLIKGTLIVTVSIFAALFFVVLFGQGYRILAYCIGILPLVSAVLFWSLARQPVTALPSFIATAMEVVSGYSQAMAINHGNGFQIATWILTAGFIVYSAAGTKSGPPASRILLCLSMTLFLFISFKEGFVRHMGVVSGISALMAALLLNVVLRDRMVIATLVVALVWWGNAGVQHFPVSPLELYNNVTKTYSAVTFSSLFEGVKEHWRRVDEEKFADSLEVIRRKAPIPRLPGSTDIYSVHQAELLASGNSWSPRPALQSYNAYTPRLAFLDKAHLLSKDAPDNLLFQIEPADGRLPALEEGLSWPTIINKYSFIKMEGKFAYFRQRTGQHEEMPIKNLTTATHDMGQEVYLPATTKPLFAEVDISPTLLGSLATLLFKTDELRISIQLADGIREYRMVSNMAKSRFLLSPLIENTSDFVLLTGFDKANVPAKVVKSIRIFPSGGNSLFWKSAYSMRLSNSDLAGDTNLQQFTLFDRILAQRPKADTETVADRCDLGIDWINGMPPARTPTLISNRLAVKGWTAISVKDGVAADKVFLTLSNATERLYVETRTEPRPDVGSVFGHADMPDTGFVTDVDVSKLNGEYRLSLARIYKNNLDSCPQQLEVPLRFGR